MERQEALKAFREGFGAEAEDVFSAAVRIRAFSPTSAKSRAFATTAPAVPSRAKE